MLVTRALLGTSSFSAKGAVDRKLDGIFTDAPATKTAGLESRHVKTTDDSWRPRCSGVSNKVEPIPLEQERISALALT